MSNHLEYHWFYPDVIEIDENGKETVIPGQPFIGDPIDAAKKRLTYKHVYGEAWFSATPYAVISHLGFDIEPKKTNNLLDLSDGNPWNILSLMPPHMRKEQGEEWINFLLGPVAIGLKNQGLKFHQIERVFSYAGINVFLDAMDLNHIPKAARKELYEKIIPRFNDDVGMDNSLERARVVFYEILGEILKPLMEQMGDGDLSLLVSDILTNNPSQVEQAKTDPKVVGWLMGQVMRSSKTKLDPNRVRAVILEKIDF